MANFYDDLSRYYHLIYRDWESSIEEQAAALDRLIRQETNRSAHRLLDVSCGIGTQSLGLARCGYEVTASDLSADSIERAKREAEARQLSISFCVADMQAAFERHGPGYDVVLSCDNSVPHLLSDAEIQVAFEQFYRCTRPGGLCLISVRDYAAMDLGGTQVKPYGIRVEGDVRYILFQVWDFEGDHYDLTMYIVEDHGSSQCCTHALRSRYYTVSIERLMELLRRAGFEDVRRIDDQFFQPVIVGVSP